MSGQCVEVAKLSKSQHVDSYLGRSYLTKRRFNLIPMYLDINISYDGISPIVIVRSLHWKDGPVAQRFKGNTAEPAERLP